MSTPAPGRLSLVGTDPSAHATYPPVAASDIAYLEIFPPVGIGRFGDSQVGYFLSPEVPGRTDPPAGITSFRGSDQGILRQGVRFRVYAYDVQGNILGEVNSQNGYNLNWRVHVANKKPANLTYYGRFEPVSTTRRNPDVQPDVDLDLRDRLIVDPGVQSISSSDGANIVNLEGQFYGSRENATSIYLGQLQVDDAGHLIFIAGSGRAQSITDPNDSQPEILSEFDNVDWVDTACDGWVRVHVTGNNLDMASGHAATVSCGPPNFSWGIDSPTTLYNIMEDVYWRRGEQPTLTMIEQLGYDFATDIWPVLQAATLTSWANSIALQGHGCTTNGNFTSNEVINTLQNGTLAERTALKIRIFERLRKPGFQDWSQADARWMPRLSGDNGDMPEPGTFPRRQRPGDPPKPDIRRFAALTWLQYERFRTWKDDDTPLGSWPPARQSRIEDVPLQAQPDYLTHASTDSTVGDPIFPGIEVGWIAKELSTYDLGVTGLQPPFRVNHPPEVDVPVPSNYIQPGYLTRALSLPWQSDFVLCSGHWWPCVRPDDVVLKVTYDIIMGDSGTVKQFERAVSTRQGWTRGFREFVSMGQSRISHDVPWYPSTDMVRYWGHLGILRKFEREYQGETRTAYVENERLGF